MRLRVARPRQWCGSRSTQAAARATASGVLFRSDGHILTAAHLLDAADRTDVALDDGRTLPGSVVGRDELTDVAVLKVAAQDLPTAVLGSTDAVTVGSPVVAVGAPTRSGAEPSVTAGVISAVGQRVQPPGGAPIQGMLQTDVDLSASADGGALLDMRGSLVGISTTGGATATTTGFAVPVEIARKVAWDLVRHGSARHVWLGVEGADVAPDATDDVGASAGMQVLARPRRQPRDPPPASRWAT